VKVRTPCSCAGIPPVERPWDLAEKLTGGMLPAFPQQFLPRLSPDLHQFVQLLIELLGATTHTRLHQFFQPGQLRCATGTSGLTQRRSPARDRIQIGRQEPCKTDGMRRLVPGE